MHEKSEAHWDAAICVVRYIKGCPGQGIMLTGNNDLRLDVYCDSDDVSSPKSHQSLPTFVMFLGGSPISWKAKKQDTLSHSSAEAEYREMSAALRELQWLRELLADFGVLNLEPMKSFCDSKDAINIAANPVFYERTKHIENDCHSVRDAVQNFEEFRFSYLLSKLGVSNLHTPP